MNVISQDDFIERCKQGRCLRQTLKSKQCEEEYKQKQCYNKYVDKKIKEWERDHTDYEWLSLKEELKLRDNNQCRFYQIATVQERNILDKIIIGNKILSTLDGAHVISRSACKQMIYHTDNVYTLYRWVHQCLDNYIDPIKNIPITKEEIQIYWCRIIGEEKYNELYRRYRNYVNNL